MTKDEALKLALEALESCYSTGDDYKYQFYDDDLTIPAITAIKKALANEALEKMAENARELGLDYEPEQAVGITRYANISVGKIIHNSSPPQRTWVGLTPDELNAIFDGMKTWSSFQITDVYFAIEAKLRSKNT